MNISATLPVLNASHLGLSAQNRGSLAMDMIADVSVGSNEPGSLSKWLKDRHGIGGLKEARFKPQAFKAIEDMWPSWVEVTNRVFANDVKTYRDVCKRAAAEPNQEEAIVVYVNCVFAFVPIPLPSKL